MHEVISIVSNSEEMKRREKEIKRMKIGALVNEFLSLPCAEIGKALMNAQGSVEQEFDPKYIRSVKAEIYEMSDTEIMERLVECGRQFDERKRNEEFAPTADFVLRFSTLIEVCNIRELYKFHLSPREKEIKSKGEDNVLTFPNKN